MCRNSQHEPVKQKITQRRHSADTLGNLILWWDLLHEITVPVYVTRCIHRGTLVISLNNYNSPNRWQMVLNQKKKHQTFVFVDQNKLGRKFYAKVRWKCLHVSWKCCLRRQSPLQLCDSALLSSSKRNCCALYQLDKGGSVFHKSTALKKIFGDLIHFPHRNFEKCQVMTGRNHWLILCLMLKLLLLIHAVH